ncbi:MAG: type I polyketide synthase, partial [Myxococcales bacterium]|nr:type I polyketide synthase [Myxococcales bacterium]
MPEHVHRAIAIVGVGAVLPDAPDARRFWTNLVEGRYSIGETPPERWDPALYYDADPKAPEKTYSKIGGWVRQYDWDPLRWRLPIPPKVGDAMDRTQKWAIIATREALADYGYPERPLDRERTAVIFGNAMAGDKHYLTALRVYLPEYAQELERSESFAALPPAARTAILAETVAGVRRRLPDITEDTMPGELANIIAGRVAALFDLHGPNYICDAACASAMAAINAAVEGLEELDYDAVITGGIDGNMSASSFVKFCKIGALSATGTRPYDAGADGFVMGEGAVVFVLKRLEDAEQAGDRIYAVIRGLGGSSDGRGKGITAPNPKGQQLAVKRAWAHAGLSPATATLIEGHGTSTRVGDVVEVESLAAVFSEAGVRGRKIPLGSVKSNIGHLKGAAGAAGLLKAVLALHHKQIPPSLGLETPNPKIDFDRAPFRVNVELTPWDEVIDGARRAGVSAFGFGGTNFHTVLEEHVPGRIQRPRERVQVIGSGAPDPASKAPLRGALVIGGTSPAEVARGLRAAIDDAQRGHTPQVLAPRAHDLEAPCRIAIDYADAGELAKKGTRALEALEAGSAGHLLALRAQGVFYREGEAAKVAFLYTGQGSQYVNMLAGLARTEPVVREAFAEADAVLQPLLGRPLTELLFVPHDDASAVAAAEDRLRQTSVTQPAVLAVDVALTRLLAAYGVVPDMVMGHSLGEYGALVAAGGLPFADALEAVSARGREMMRLAVEDNGWMV